MNVYVINQDQIKKYSLMLVAALITSFILGFYTAVYYAEFKTSDKQIVLEKSAIEQTAEQAASEAEGEAASEAQTEAASESQKNVNAEEKDAAENKSGNKTLSKAEADKAEKIKQEQLKQEQIKQEQIKQEQIKQERQKQQQLKQEKIRQEQLKQEQLKQEQLKQEKIKQQQEAEQISSDNASGIKPPVSGQAAPTKQFYSIQAGMFTSKENALSFIEELNAKNFDAYVADFVSSSGSVKYNVRVGRFEQRDEARDGLIEFQKSFSTPAYVVISQ